MASRAHRCPCGHEHLRPGRLCALCRELSPSARARRWALLERKRAWGRLRRQVP